MSRRFLSSITILATVIAGIVLLATPVLGQAQAPAARSSSSSTAAPRTPWGDPDLQGVWNNATSTPLQRPAQFGEKPVLNEDEAAEYQEQVAENLTRDRRDGGPEADVNRAYNDHWMDPKRLLLVGDKRTSLITDPPDGRIPPAVPLSPERQRRREQEALEGRAFAAGMPFSAQATGDALRCIIRTDRPPYLGIIYNNTYHIFQSPGYVAIAPEMIHSARIIPLDGRPHVGQGLQLWLGDTRGHFEGNTLVVETTNFRDEGTYGAADPKTYKITERFTRVDANTLKYEFTISDPSTWTKPWSAMVPWTKIDPGEQMYRVHVSRGQLRHRPPAGGRPQARGGRRNDGISGAKGWSGGQSRSVRS